MVWSRRAASLMPRGDSSTGLGGKLESAKHISNLFEVGEDGFEEILITICFLKQWRKYLFPRIDKHCPR